MSVRHTISILLENEAGALSRVAGLFSARAYNIESLSVAPTEDPTVSRLTLVTAGAALTLAAAPSFALWSTGGLATAPFALLIFVLFERLALRPGAPDVRGAARERGSRGDSDSESYSALLFGETLLGARLRDLRTVIRFLRERKSMRRIALWGDSFAAVNAPDTSFKVPRRVSGRGWWVVV